MSEPFDFDAFIAGTSLPRRVVSAYGVDHRDQIAHLTRAHDRIVLDAGDERESSTSAPRRKELADQIGALRDEMEASEVQWIIRTLSPQEFAKTKDDDSLDIFDQLALQSKAPEDATNPSLYKDLSQLTADQWRKIATAIGAAQWAQIATDANALILSKVAVPDFSQSVSATLSPPASSEN